MLRLIVILLLLANAAYYAWSQGHLAVLGLAPVPQTEPARVAAQIKPEALRVLSNNEARTIEGTATTTPLPTQLAQTSAAPIASDAKPTECLQSAVLTEGVASRVRNAASQALPSGSWAMEQIDEPGRWIVYMGKYNDPEVLAKKKSELRQLGVTTEPLQNTKLEPGISLGGFASQALATKEFDSLGKRGVRSAKVVQEVAPAKGPVLRLPAVDEALRGQLEPIKSALGTASLSACKA
jgi:hypothetical protein